jgi:hypothetical protein
MLCGNNTLKVTAVEARGLAKADFFGKSDPFCELRIVSPYPTRGTVQRTRTIKCNLNPVWNESFTFHPLHPREDRLEIKGRPTTHNTSQPTPPHQHTTSSPTHQLEPLSIPNTHTVYDWDAASNNDLM